MPSVSKQQQKFFGLVRALQKGDVSPSSVTKKARDAAKDMNEDTVEVQPDFELIAFDFVSNPSTHGAFLSPTNEGKLNEGVGTRDGVCCHDCKVENIINDIFRG